MISQLESFIIKGRLLHPLFPLFLSVFFDSHLWLVSPFDHMTRCFLSLSLSSSWSDHTPHVSQGYQTGETSSDLANKRSINGAVERVTHASQNLLRSNNPLQLPLHWSDPWAARALWSQILWEKMVALNCQLLLLFKKMYAARFNC